MKKFILLVFVALMLPQMLSAQTQAEVRARYESQRNSILNEINESQATLDRMASLMAAEDAYRQPHEPHSEAYLQYQRESLAAALNVKVLNIQLERLQSNYDADMQAALKYEQELKRQQEAQRKADAKKKQQAADDAKRKKQAAQEEERIRQQQAAEAARLRELKRQEEEAKRREEEAMRREAAAAQATAEYMQRTEEQTQNKHANVEFHSARMQEVYDRTVHVRKMENYGQVRDAEGLKLSEAERSRRAARVINSKLRPGGAPEVYDGYFYLGDEPGVAYADRDSVVAAYYREKRIEDSLLLAEPIYNPEKLSHGFFSELYHAFFADSSVNAATAREQAFLFDKEIAKMDVNDVRYMEHFYGDYHELSVLADYSYLDGDLALPKDWTDLKDDPKVGKVIKDIIADGGFDAGLKWSIHKKGDRYVLAFAGTDFIKKPYTIEGISEFLNDAYTDYEGTFHSNAPQVKIAGTVVQRLVQEAGIPLEKLEFTGHSLGGRLASEMSVKFGCPATTFNGAGVSPETYKIYEFQQKNAKSGWRGHIRNVVAANDMLTVLQKHASGATNEYVAALPKEQIEILHKTFSETLSSEEGESLMTLLGKGTAGVIRGLDAFFAKAHTINKYYNRDYRQIGGILMIDEAMSGHSIRPLSETLERRKQSCHDEVNSRMTTPDAK